ncbi:MAG: oxidoreductase [Bryobacterales bacterium]|nr:oxidoreductase [Bryobacterales bacterium]
MRLLLICLLLTLPVAAQTPDWKSVTDLPRVDVSGMNAAQKQTLLKLLRESDCSCGCGMKIAQCRVQDPNCSYSRSLAAVAVKGVRDGKSPDEIRKALAAGAGPRKVLDDPITLRTLGSPTKGPENAKITLVEFSDFQCPYCSKAVTEIDAVLKAFPNDVKLVYKQFPLSEIHSRAMLASQAALAANAQGKFWPMHDKMFANNQSLTRENMLKWAGDLGLDMKRFTADMDAPETKKQIARDLADGEQAGVEGTPTVFVNGKHYNGSLDPQSFGEVLKSELKH